MAGFSGFLQADGYAGFEALYDIGRTNPGVPANASITEVACWAHCRRKFFDVWQATKSPVAKEALDRIAAIYVIEAKAQFAPAAERVEHRKETGPLLDAFFAWAGATVVKLSAKSALAEAFRYTIKRRKALSRFVTDGRLEVDNNIAENAMRAIATPVSLCTSSSSIWKHWELNAGIDVTRAPFTPGRLHHRRRVQVGGTDLERRARNNLLGAKNTGFDQLAEPMAGDAASRRRLAQGQPGAVLLRGLVGVDAADTPDRTDPVRRPGLVLSGWQAHPVQRGCDVLVGPAGGHAPNDRQGVVGSAARVLTGTGFAQPKFGVLSPFPMDDQDDLTRLFIDINGDLVDQGAHQLLAATHGDVGVLPGGFEILGDGPQVRHHRCRGAGHRLVKAALTGADAA
jgi:hypothetical protein